MAIKTNVRLTTDRWKSLVLIVSLVGCGCSSPTPNVTGQVAPQIIEVPCNVDPPYPYPAASPYGGIHANRENNDVVSCTTARNFLQSWHSLKGLAIAVPNTFSPDGLTTYVTTANPEPSGCRLHALDTADGSVNWCRSYPPGIWGSAVEVDEDGYLYFTTDAHIVSLHPDGRDRWAMALPGSGDDFGAYMGLHFTPDGHIAVVTGGGVVVLVRRSDGELLATLDIAETWGFVAPSSVLTDIHFEFLLPEEMKTDITTTFGSIQAAEPIFSALIGASGVFCDNTIAVSSRNDLFVIGGGPDPDNGALVQVVITGSSDQPQLEPGWYAVTNGASGTSPSVTPDGRYVSVGDGASNNLLFGSGAVQPKMKVADVTACDQNSDADSDPAICGFINEFSLEWISESKHLCAANKGG